MSTSKLIPKKYIKESLIVHKNTKAINTALQRIQRITAKVSFVTPVNNGITNLEEKTKNKIAEIKVYDKENVEIKWSKNYTESSTLKAQEKVTYIVNLQEKDPDTLEGDLKKIKFYFWVQDEKGNRIEITTPTKTLRITRNRTSTERNTDVFELHHPETLSSNLQQAYYYARVQHDVEKKEARLTIQWSKWMDRYMVRVEAAQHIPKGDGGNTTCSRYVQAAPEIIKGCWVNAKKENIDNKIVGYKDTVYMCLKTLGMVGKVITTELWEQGIRFMGSSNSDEKMCRNENIAWQLSDRYSYKKLEIPDKDTEEYKKQRSAIWEKDPLELYFTLPSEKQTPGCQTKYGELLYLSVKEQIVKVYFAKAVKKEAIRDGTVAEEESTSPQVHTVKRGDTLHKIAKKYNTTSEKLASHNNIANPNAITVGQTLKLPGDATAPKGNPTAAPKKEKRAEQQTFYEQIHSTTLGSEVYIVAETTNMHVRYLTLRLFDKEKLLAKTDTEAIPLVQDDTEVTKLENLKVDHTGKAVVKVKLRKKSDEDYQKQKEEFTPEEDEEEKIAKLSIGVSYIDTGQVPRYKKFLEGEEFEVGAKNCCVSLITSEQLQKIFTTANKETIDALRDEFNNAFKKFKINTCLRKAHFFAQIREEIGNSISIFSENLNYSVQALKNTFSYFRKHPEEAELYGRSQAHLANQEAIANRAYANRLGNGNIESGDGWRFRGKGFIQLTGKTNYEHINEEISAKYPNSGIDIIENDTDILTTKGALLSAMGYWTFNNLNAISDQGKEDSHIDAITAIVNYYTESYSKRRNHFDTTSNIFNINECITN